MAQATYDAHALVLRGTKLGESDLIVTFLADDGSQIRAVAKGARKPTSSFAARLEPFSQVDMLVARGRTLDIVKEARLVASNDALRRSLELSACAAPGAELLSKVSQVGLENPRLFALSTTALASMADADIDHAVAMSAAWLLKTFAFAGVQPCFGCCVQCGSPIGFGVPESNACFSYLEGGSLCPECARQCDSLSVPLPVIAWSEAFLRSTFAEIGQMPVDRSGSFGALRLCQQWCHHHVGTNLKSLDFLFTCGLL